MEQNELFSACRHGYLDKLKFLVEERDIELNVRDIWDSTPLYYACLCGHPEVVLYLLEKGIYLYENVIEYQFFALGFHRSEAIRVTVLAVIPNSFDGERCLYGALTGEIRQLLVQHKAITSQIVRRSPYSEFLRCLLDDPEFSDVAFHIHGETSRYHRCVLSARSPFFRDQFAGKWRNRAEIYNNHPLVDPEAFRAVMEYIYTGRLEVNIGLVDACLKLAHQFRLDSLDARLSLQKKEAIFFVKTKYSARIFTLVIEPQAGIHELHYNLGNLARHCQPVMMGGDAENLSQDDDGLWRHLSDVIFTVQRKRFRCHKAFVCNRSEYLRILMSDHFHENTFSKKGIPVIELHNITAETFTAVVQFIYQDFAQDLSTDNVLEVLFTAELYLLPGLKKQCASIIAENLDVTCVIELLKAARSLQLPRLQMACIQFIAVNIEMLVTDPALAKLILDDAGEVENRQDTDSIGMVDDIRFCITNNLQTFSDTAEAHDRLALIDALLDQLGLDA